MKTRNEPAKERLTKSDVDAAARLLGRLEQRAGKKVSGRLTKAPEKIHNSTEGPDVEPAGEMAARVSASLTGRVLVSADNDNRAWVTRGERERRESHPGHPVYVETVEADTSAAAEGKGATEVDICPAVGPGEASIPLGRVQRGFGCKRLSVGVSTARWGEF